MGDTTARCSLGLQKFAKVSHKNLTNNGNISIVQTKQWIINRWGEGGAYFGVPAQTLLGEMSYWDDIPPKRGKGELEPLGACHER